jgi:hypothetical protein
MKKLYLEDVIEKYHLGGLVERVKLSVKDKVLQTKFLSAKKNLVGSMEAPGIDLEDCEFGVYNTSQLLKLIGITDHFLTLGIEKQGKTVNKLLIADNEFNLEYTLADIMLTPAIPSIEEPNYDMAADITPEFVSKFLKAKKALDADVFTVEQAYDTENNPVMKFILGGTEGYTNKINFTFPTTKSTIPGNVVKFPIEEFNEILAVNKEFEKGILEVSAEGLMKMSFENKENVKASYLLVGKE